jgi:hypothetical protein
MIHAIASFSFLVAATISVTVTAAWVPNLIIPPRRISQPLVLFAAPPSQKQQQPQAISDDTREDSATQTLLQTVLNLDPEWKQHSFDFIDPQSPNRCIPCHIAFMVPYDGVPFYIGTPIHSIVAVLCEPELQDAFFLDPDIEDNVEMMERAVAEFYKVFGQDSGIQFQRCPRALTVAEGDLSRLTGYSSLASSKSSLSSSPSYSSKAKQSIQEMIDDTSDFSFLSDKNDEGDNHDQEYLDAFFHREVGEDFIQSLRDTPPHDLEEIKDLFQFPHLLENNKNGQEEYDILLNDLFSENEWQDNQSELKNEQQKGIETAVRLVQFQGPDGNVYTLTQLIQPMILVAKEVDEEKVLLTPFEAQAMVPKLEKILQQELTKIMAS